MRVLLGGLIGASASAAAWFFLEYVTGNEMGWLAILVGIITGLCINAAAGAGSAESYARGALAVALTMLAMVGGRFVYAQVMQNVSQVATLDPAARQAVAVDEQAAVDVQPGEAAAAVADPEQAARAEPVRNSNVDGVRVPRPTADTYSDINMLWMAVAALAAYFTGKGSGKTAPVAVSDEPLPEAPATTSI